jgi:hypothetical protein
MTASPDSPVVQSASGTPSAIDPNAVDRPAASAAARVFAAGVGLGALGLGGVTFVLVRLLESWRVSPQAASHHVTILDQRLSYPTANADAIVVVALAVLALIAVARGARRATREAIGSVRLQRRLGRVSRDERSGALVIGDARPLAFCAGLLRPRIYLSTGALTALDEHALRAVLDHERHHARRRDPLRLATGRVLEDALFFVPGLRELARRQQALAELSADEGAIRAAPANRSGLARAMLSFSDSSTDEQPVGFDPARVDYLLGEPPSWRFPALLCLSAAAVLALLAAVAVLAGRIAAGTATLAPPFLSSQPCITVLAALPAALALIAWSGARRLLAARRPWRSSPGAAHVGPSPPVRKRRVAPGRFPGGNRRPGG